MNIRAANGAAWSAPAFATTATRPTSSTTAPPASGITTPLASKATSATTAPAAASDIDFKNTTRQEVFDWMNGEIRAGRMTVDESTPFLGMTLKMSATTFQPVDMATDEEHINFVHKAQLGIEWADAHGQRDQAAYLRHAVEIMQRVEAQSQSLDVVA